MSSEAFVTLETNDDCALVLGQSIGQVGTTRNLVVFISDHLSNSMKFYWISFSIDLTIVFVSKKSLEKSFDEVIRVDQLDSNDEEHL